MHTASASVQIDAPPAVVWAVLTDLAGYSDWNPLFKEASGEVDTGRWIVLRSVNPLNGRLMTVKPKITVVQPEQELRWVSSLPGIIRGEHSFILTAVDEGTQLVQSETYRGLLSRLSGRNLARTEASFAELNQALKQQAEQLS
jgi:hypothetical protein